MRQHARIGIVVEDLTVRRDEVVSLAEDILCPSAILPGAPPKRSAVRSVARHIAVVDSDRRRGARLDRARRIAAGRQAPRPRCCARRICPAPRTAWAARAAIERDWLEDGPPRGDAGRCQWPRSSAAHRPWRRAGAAPRRCSSASARLRPAAWADAWRTWLAAAGWPGSRTLDSAEYQAHEAWERLLLQFSSLGAVASRMSRSAAVDKLRAMSRETVFQPEGSDAPIQILGVLEASGISFDALWVVGSRRGSLAARAQSQSDAAGRLAARAADSARAARPENWRLPAH